MGYVIYISFHEQPFEKNHTHHIPDARRRVRRHWLCPLIRIYRGAFRMDKYCRCHRQSAPSVPAKRTDGKCDRQCPCAKFLGKHIRVGYPPSGDSKRSRGNQPRCNRLGRTCPADRWASKKRLLYRSKTILRIRQHLFISAHNTRIF